MIVVLVLVILIIVVLVLTSFVFSRSWNYPSSYNFLSYYYDRFGGLGGSSATGVTIIKIILVFSAIALYTFTILVFSAIALYTFTF